MSRLILCALLLLPSLSWATGEIGDVAIHAAPAPPTLPAKGHTFVDPTYGTTIMRVTDTTDGARAGNAYSIWSPFNCNSTRFQISIAPTVNGNASSYLYNFDPINFTSTKVGLLPTSGLSVDYATARWHPTNPDVLYGLVPATQTRYVYTVNVATSVKALFKDFTSVTPLGGYPISFSMSEDGNVLAFYSSTAGSQDNGDFVTAYKISTDTTYTLAFGTLTGLHNIHSTFLDKSGDYVVIHVNQAVAGQPVYYFWHLPDNTLSTPLLWTQADSPGGHYTFGSAVTYNPYWLGGSLVTRNLATPHTNSIAVTYPTRDGAINNQQDATRSWVNLDSRFFFNNNLTNSQVLGWTLQSGAIYKRTSFTTATATPRAPEVVYHNGTSLTQSLSLGAMSAGTWYYDATGNGTLYVWLPGSADATNTSTNIVIAFAWWPLMDEIMQIWVDDAPGNLTKIRRLAHHQSRCTVSGCFVNSPLAASDRSGQYVMFNSNWGGTAQRDVFIIQVDPSGAPSPPTPDPPASLSISTNDTLTWPPSSDVTLAGYHIYRGTTSGVYDFRIDRTPELAALTHSPITRFIDRLPIAGTYYYIVKAYLTNGNEGAASNEVSIVAPGLTMRAVRQ